MSEERSDEESGWGKAWIYQPPPRSLAEPALSEAEGLGLTLLLYDGRQTGMKPRDRHGSLAALGGLAMTTKTPV